MIWIRAILCCALTVGFAGCRANGPRDVSLQRQTNSGVSEMSRFGASHGSQSKQKSGLAPKRLTSRNVAQKLLAKHDDKRPPEIGQVDYTDSLPESRYIRRANGSSIQDADDRDNSKYVDREKIEATKVPRNDDQQSTREQPERSQSGSDPPQELLTCLLYTSPSPRDRG